MVFRVRRIWSGKTSVVVVCFLAVLTVAFLIVERSQRKAPGRAYERWNAPSSAARVISERRVPSDDPYYSNALEIVLQTDRTIDPVAFVTQYDGEVAMGRAVLRSDGQYLLYTRTKQGIPADHPTWFVFEWDGPAFSPQSPLVITVFSTKPIRLIQIDEVKYEWP